MSSNWWMQSSMLNALVTHWLWLTAWLRRSILIIVTLTLLMSIAWAPSQISASPAPIVPVTSEPQRVLAAMPLRELHQLTEGWSDVAITTQQQRYSLQMPATWAQLYRLADAVSNSAHHADSYKLQWLRTNHTDAAETTFALVMQLQPGRYRASNSESGFASFIPMVPEVMPITEPRACPAPPIPALKLMAVWPSRNSVQLLTEHGAQRLKVHQLLDSTWQLAVIGRDFVEFSWQHPDRFCPVEVFTVAI